MATIDDFMDHRWEDAKAALRELDPDFVSNLESTVRLQEGGLAPPWGDAMSERKTQQRLSTEWHRLLEACQGLTMEALLLQGTAVDLTAAANSDLRPVEAGRRFFHHFSSLFGHATTLTECAQAVITHTAALYVADLEKRATLVKSYKERVNQEITKKVKPMRNDLLHVKTRPWASAIITKDSLWEPSVAVGLTPQKSLVVSIFPLFGSYVASGKYDECVDIATRILDSLSGILQSLESEIQNR